MSGHRRFGRRSEDYTKQVMVARLLTFTDLMAVLLSFFVLLYATRDPAPAQKIRIDPVVIAPIVAPAPQTKPKMTKGPVGLDLNYVAALLNQARTRDPVLERAAVVIMPEAVLVRAPKAITPKDAAYLVDVIGRYQRPMEIFGSPALIQILMASKETGNRLYFPQDGAELRILVH